MKIYKMEILCCDDCPNVFEYPANTYACTILKRIVGKTVGDGTMTVPIPADCPLEDVEVKE